MKRPSACPASCVLMTALTLVTTIHVFGCSGYPGEAPMEHDASDEPGTNASSPPSDSETGEPETGPLGCDACGANQVCVDDVCVCEPGYQDCDGSIANGCETSGDCVCEIGAQRPCYHGPAATQNVGTCTAGVETCQGNGWSYCVGQVLPQMESCEANGLDDDCDGVVDETEDLDGDGFTVCDGDCCDDPNGHCAQVAALVNPGAYDVAGNNLDDDCDGEIDNAPTRNCSDLMITEALTGDDLVMAMDLCQFTDGHPHIWGVMDAQLRQADGEGSPSDLQSAVLEGLGQGRLPPRENATLAALSSGDARGLGDPGYTPGMSDEFQQNIGPGDYLEVHHYALETSDACPTSNPAFHDTVQLQTRIRVPTNAQGIKFQFRFFTYEFPLYLCTEFNDFFLALLDSDHPDIPDDKNISFDAAGNPVSVNNAFFTTCEPLICGNPSTTYLLAPDTDQDGCADALKCNLDTNQCETALGACPDGPNDLGAFTENISNAGATGWLTTTAPRDTGRGNHFELSYLGHR